MFSVVVSILLLSVIFVFARFTVLAVLLICRDSVVFTSFASLSSIANPPLFLSFLNHVIFPLSESLRCRFTPDPLVITIVRLLGPVGGSHAAGFCLGSLSPTFGSGVVVSFVAGGIQYMSLPRVGDTSYTSFLIISVLYSPSTVVYLCV